MGLDRLDKILSNTGICSRTEAKTRIKSGRVSVNGKTETDPTAKFDSKSCIIELDGSMIDNAEHLYIMYYKPSGLLSASRDSRQPTIMDQLPEIWKKRGIFPVGRLDKDTTGLMILTDDGGLAHRILSPSSHISKLYRAVVDGVPSVDDVDAFGRGIILKDGTQCLPARLIIGNDTGVLYVEVFEGKYHQVKRMLASRLLYVRELHRARIGGLVLDTDLQPGMYRLMDEDDIRLIFQ